MRISHRTRWHPLRKVLFRFAAVYFPWYALPFVLYTVPFGTALSKPFTELWAHVLSWVGSRVLGLEAELRFATTGSGDTLAAWVHLVVMLTVSLVACLAWTLLDRRRRHYGRAGRWLHLACRYYLLIVMLAYGTSKVFTGQFPSPHLWRLVQPYGDSSPMGLLWTFMGASAPYTFFAGLGELIGGLLLVSRRTSTLGALVVIGVMSNVVMLNFAFDVPVKLFSSHLLLFALVLVALDGRRLLRVFVFNRPVGAVAEPPYFVSRGGRRWRLAVKTGLVGALLVSHFLDGIELERQYGPGAPKPALYGLYEVELFRLDGEERPPLLTDAARWRYFIVDRFPGVAHIYGIDGTRRAMAFEVDESLRTATLATFEDRGRKESWTWERPAEDRLVMSGELDGAEITVELRKRDLTDFLLLSRGFHWVNEFPFNR